MQELDMPRFTLDQSEEWTRYLDEYGIVVVKNVVPMDDIIKARSLYWDWLESLERGISRDDPATWSNERWPGDSSLGFTTTHGGGHSKASWFLRAHARVKSTFAALWGTSSLLTSFDTFICWRPWAASTLQHPNSVSSAVGADLAKRRPSTEGLHIDQNPFFKCGRHAVQGMIPLFPVNQAVGGLQVVPKTHVQNSQEGLMARYTELAENDDDWCPLGIDDPIQGEGRLVIADPGDMILWDSRTVHGGCIGTGSATTTGDLVRLSFTVCQTPYSFMEEGKEHEILCKRRRAFRRQECLNHWPHECDVVHQVNGSEGVRRSKPPDIEVTPQISDLIGNPALIGFDGPRIKFPRTRLEINDSEDEQSPFIARPTGLGYPTPYPEALVKDLRRSWMQQEDKTHARYDWGAWQLMPGSEGYEGIISRFSKFLKEYWNPLGRRPTQKRVYHTNMYANADIEEYISLLLEGSSKRQQDDEGLGQRQAIRTQHEEILGLRGQNYEDVDILHETFCQGASACAALGEAFERQSFEGINDYHWKALFQEAIQAMPPLAPQRLQFGVESWPEHAKSLCAQSVASDCSCSSRAYRSVPCNCSDVSVDSISEWGDWSTDPGTGRSFWNFLA